QFEAGKASVGKNGIVRDPAVHQRVLEEILDFAQSNGFNILDLSFSPITGGEGNIEFLVHLQKVQNGDGTRKAEISVPQIVAEAHET
ncbi:SAM-dependent methyltransferase, partial [Bacillus cereus group sp. BC244]